MRSGLAPALCAALVAVAAAPATAGTLTFGLQGGMYSPRIGGDATGGRTFDDDAFSVAPVLDATAGPFGLTLKYLYAPYELEGERPGSTIDVDKHDLDVALRVRVPVTDDGAFTMTPFVGFRYERQRAEGDRGGALADVDDSFELHAFPVGVTAAYGFPEIGLTPFVALTIFPYVSVFDFQERNFRGSGVFAAEGGAAWSLLDVLDVPVSLTASYRYQLLEPDAFEEEVQQLGVGVFYHLLDLF